MRILLCMRNSTTDYSGGRYHAWMMAESLSFRGHAVTIWTNCIPAFNEDFTGFPEHYSIDIQVCPHFQKQPSGHYDLIILIPHLKEPYNFYLKVLLIARREGVRLILLNFETPNWFNKFSSKPRNEKLWQMSVEVSHVADMILSISKESSQYAQIYFNKTHPLTQFRYWYPSINSFAADDVGSTPQKKQVICITRFFRKQTHKGGGELIKVFCSALYGYELVIIVGSGDIDPITRKELQKKSKQFNISLRFLYKISDKEKFTEIKSSRLMLFLSFFEGFGYPPAESLYCDVPCIVYDLPVLREVYGNSLIYVPPGDMNALQASIKSVLSGAYSPISSLKESIKSKVYFDTNAYRLENLINQLIASPNTPVISNSSYKSYKDWRNKLILLKIRDIVLMPWKIALNFKKKIKKVLF